MKQSLPPLSIILRIILGVVLAVMLLTATPTAAQDRMVVGYYPEYRHATYPHTAIKFDNITHLAHSFIWPSSDGSGALVVPSGFIYPELIAAAHEADVEVIVALGGAGQTAGFGPAASDPDTRALLVDNIVAFVQDNGYDGVDLDWEGFSDATYKNALIALIQELDAALDSADPELTLSMPLGATNWHGAYDMPAVADNLDWIGIMTYDFHGTWTPHAGHNSPLHHAAGDADHFSLSQSIEYWLERGVPREKMLPGMAFYGQSWQDVTEHMGPRTGPITAMTYAGISELIEDDGWERHWDDDAMVPYLLNPEEEIFVSYDDAESISHKVAYVLEEDLAGAILWEISQDYLPSGDQPLLTAAGLLLQSPVASERDDGLPVQTTLEQSYPNPFTSSTTIPFNVKQTTHVTIEVFDVMGRRIATLVDGVVAAGSHKTVWKAGGRQASGFYIYQMQTGESTQSGSVVLTR